MNRNKNTKFMVRKKKHFFLFSQDYIRGNSTARTKIRIDENSDIRIDDNAKMNKQRRKCYF